MFFLLSLYQQDVLGFSPLRTGVGNLAIALTIIAVSTVSQARVTRVGVKPVLTFGLVSLSGGLVYFTQISANGSYFADVFDDAHEQLAHERRRETDRADGRLQVGLLGRCRHRRDRLCAVLVVLRPEELRLDVETDEPLAADEQIAA